MSKAAVFTMKLEPDLRAEFIAAAEASHRPASQVVRELMRDFVQRHRDRREYSALLHDKVDRSRVSIADGRGRSGAEVEADFAERRGRAGDRT